MKTKPAKFLLALVLMLGVTYSVRADDSLPFWNETTTKKAIIDFVGRVTKEGSRDFVKPEERIATFDNDVTLWIRSAMRPWLKPKRKAGSASA